MTHHYASIPHYKLIKAIEACFDDAKVIKMLTNIISNPIDTPYGFKNPSNGIALRGPLSQLFSGIYLKPLDDAFDRMEVTYIRYQDDIVILCKTKRQFNRAKRRMMKVLGERRLTLSRKKTRMGRIDGGFHFLGVDYSGTRPLDNTRRHEDETQESAHILNKTGGLADSPLSHVDFEAFPHPRTLKKARDRVKLMVICGLSAQAIKRYLCRWANWWVSTVETWTVDELLTVFVNACSDGNAWAIARALQIEHCTKMVTATSGLTNREIV